MRFVRTSVLAATLCALLVNTAGAQSEPCCEPWDNGLFDRRNAQTSQTGFGEDWRAFGRVTADDFWLCEGNVYRIRTVRGQLITDSVVPKADIVILADCDGVPGEIIATAYSVLPPDADPDDCKNGSIIITETGNTTDDGNRIITVEATFAGLWLKGGAYWVSIVGYSGTADPDEEFFWGTSGNQVVKGRPGQFRDSEIGPEWISIDEICCGCTDFNFCVLGDECKILLDNGGPDLAEPLTYGSSINNNNSLSQDARTADDIVIPPCFDRELCYVEGYLYSNCIPPRARLDIYDNACKLPATFSPPISFEPSCITDTGERVTIDGRELIVYHVQFWNFALSPQQNFVLQQNKNYWFSIYGLGTGAQNQRAYFAGADRCDRTCDITFNQAAVSGRGVGLTSTHWEPVEEIYGTPFDAAFLVALKPLRRIVVEPPVVDPPVACAPDVNRDGALSVQDLFDFLAAYFAGCP